MVIHVFTVQATLSQHCASTGKSTTEDKVIFAGEYVFVPGYSLKKPVELPKYCQVRVGSFWKLSMNTSFRASDI